MSWFKQTHAQLDELIAGQDLATRNAVDLTARGVQYLAKNHVNGYRDPADAVWIVNGQYEVAEARQQIVGPKRKDRPAFRWEDICTEEGGFELLPGLADALANDFDDARRVAYLSAVKGRDGFRHWVYS